MRTRVLWALTALLLVATLFLMPGGTTVQAQPASPGFNKVQQRLLSGFASYEKDLASQVQATSVRRPEARTPLTQVLPNYFSGPNGCVERLGSNVKVNQNCLNVSDPDLQGRGQAQNETAIAQDPMSPRHLVASYNDYRRGDGTCGVSYSQDNGATWADSTVPNNFVRGTKFGAAREYFNAGGDTAVAWDTRGNVYLLCMMFMRGQPTTNNPDFSSGIYVFRSTLNNGASWNFPARPVTEDFDVKGTTLLDKPYMTVDNNPSSPFRDRIYVTWTFFDADGSAYIWEASSDDWGEHFSSPVLVSANSPLCTKTFGAGTPQGNCNENQFSQPFTGPDGALYVTWANFNNTPAANDNRNQIFLAKSTDGGKTFSAPVKASDYYDLPDCATYQGGKDPGRACVPEKGPSTDSVFRATNLPVGAVSPNDPNLVVVTVGSYINVHSKEPLCTPAGLAADGNNLFNGVKANPGCNNDILLSMSRDGGKTFTGTATDPRTLPTVNQESRQATTDQWWQWAAFNRDGKLAVAYYDRQYGNDELNGNMDFSLSGSQDLSGFATRRVTSSSMPPPTGFSGLFFGDYSGLAAVTDAHPFWMDTRAPSVSFCAGTGVPGTPPALCVPAAANGPAPNDQDVFTAQMGIPTR